MRTRKKSKKVRASQLKRKVKTTSKKKILERKQLKEINVKIREITVLRNKKIKLLMVSTEKKIKSLEEKLNR